jgi:hypothetical protein
MTRNARVPAGSVWQGGILPRASPSSPPRLLGRANSANFDFAAAWDEAIDCGTDLLEDEVMRRAKDGIDEPRFYEGEVCTSPCRGWTSSHPRIGRGLCSS